MDRKIDTKRILNSHEYSLKKLKIRNTNLDVVKVTDPMLKLINDKLPLLNLSLQDDLNYDAITDLIDYDDEEEIDVDSFRPEYAYSIEELRTMNYNPKLTEEFDHFFTDNQSTSSNYYTYSNAYLDNDNLKVFYTGKGINERSLHAFRLAYACIRLNVQPSTTRTKFIIKKLQENKPIEIIKTNEKLTNDQALAIETCGFKIDYTVKQSNIYASSFDLNQISLKNLDEAVKHVNIRTVNNTMNKHNANDYQQVDLDYLAKDYESKFEFSLNKLNRNALYEEKIDGLIYLMTKEIDEDKISKLTDKQKLIILANVLIYLNDNQTLSDLAINKLFATLGEKETNFSNSFNKYVRRLLYSPNSNQELLNILSKLNNELFNGDLDKFKNLFETIINQIRSLLADKENKRIINKKFSPEEQYTLYKILEYSLENDQLLSRECNEMIYSKILKDAAIHTRHEISCRIFGHKSKVISSPKLSQEELSKERRKEIKKIIKSEYDRLVLDKKNHFHVTTPFTAEQSYLLYLIQELNKEHNSSLSYGNYVKIYSTCLNLNPNNVNLKTIGTLISENRVKKPKAIEKEAKDMIGKSVRTAYLSLIESEGKERKGYFTNEVRYIAFKLIDRDQVASSKEMIEIIKKCNPTGRLPGNKSLSRGTFYTRLPEIDQSRKKVFDDVIEREFKKLKTQNINKLSPDRKKILQCKREIINGVIETVPGEELLSKIYDRAHSSTSSATSTTSVSTTTSSATITSATNSTRKRKCSKEDRNSLAKKARND